VQVALAALLEQTMGLKDQIRNSAQQLQRVVVLVLMAEQLTAVAVGRVAALRVVERLD
jgi:hypothetical protein